MNDFVSIVIPEFKESVYLVRCLNALLRQTKDPLEIIIAQTEFDEKSRGIIVDYLENHQKIKLVSTQEDSECNLLNLALEQARGKWILFVGVDEVLAPNAVEILLQESEDDLGDIFFNMALKQKDGLFSKLYQKSDLTQYELLTSKLNLYNHLFKRERLINHQIKFHGLSSLSEYLFVLEYHYCSETNKIIDQIFLYKDEIHALESTSLQEWNESIDTLQQLTQDFVKTRDADYNFMLINQLIIPLYQKYTNTKQEKEKELFFEILQKLLKCYQNNVEYTEYLEALLGIHLEMFLACSYPAYCAYINVVKQKLGNTQSAIQSKLLQQIESLQKQFTKEITMLKNSSNTIQNTIIQNHDLMSQERNQLRETLAGYVDIYDPAVSVVNAFYHGKLGLKTVLKCFCGWLSYKLRRKK